MGKILAATIEVQQEEIADLRERLVEVERAAEVRLARIEVLRGALEAVGADAQALKPEVQQVRDDVLDLMRERDDLRQQLAALTKLEAAHRGEEARQLDTVTALVPSAEWLVMIAENGVDSTVAHELFDLADGIRAWRGDGDGDGREEQEGESDGD